VRIRIALEGQRRDGRVPRLDADAFPAEEQEPRPQEIEQLRRGDQNSERGLRRDALEREANGEVAMNTTGRGVYSRDM